MAELAGTTIPFDGFTGYLSRPAEGQPVKGGLIVIHEIWGLVDHIKDIADRFAAEGYLVVAPDILSYAGISPEIGFEIQRLLHSADERERSTAQPLLREKMAPAHAPGYGSWAVGALQQVVDYLSVQPGVESVAVTGFCFGGTYSFALAAADERIVAAVPFYGAPPQSTDYDGFECPVLAFYGGEDERLMLGLPEVVEQMEAAGVEFEAKVYEDAGHAFFNDTNHVTYRADAAADAWTRTLAFLEKAVA